MNLGRPVVFVALSTIGLAGPWACGGSSSNGGNGGVDASSSGSSGAASSGSGSGGSGSSSGGTGSSSGSSSGSTSGGGVDSGIQIPGTPGTGALPGCAGAGTCMPPNVCCPGGGAGMGAAGDICASLSTCETNGNGGDIYTCTGQANCASGSVCCVVTGTGRNPDVASCQTSCAGARMGQVCQSSTECATGLVCQSGRFALMTCQTPFVLDSGVGTGPIACGGAMTCTAPNVCCAGGGPGNANTCSTPNGCDTMGGDTYACTGQANCGAGLSCCVTPGATPAGNDLAVCAATCTGTGNQVCQTSTECTGGLVCRTGTRVAMATCLAPVGTTDGGGSTDSGGTSTDSGGGAADAGSSEAAADAGGG